MILNVHSVTAFFLAGLGIALAVVGGGIALANLFTHVRRGPHAAAETITDRTHLLWLVLVVLAIVRGLAWPHFYLMLESFVPALASFGAMCVFGVTRIEPTLVLLLQWLKPLLLLGLGFWFVLTLAGDRRRGGGAPAMTCAALALPLTLLALAECVIEIVYLVRPKEGQLVTCCTSFRDTDAAAISENLSPLYSISTQTPAFTMTLYLALTAVVCGGAAWLGRSAARRRGWTLPTIVAIAGMVNLALTQWTWVDIVAPRVLGLPYHHCVYELLTDTAVLGPAALLTIAGSACLSWPLGLKLLRGSSEPGVDDLLSRLYAWCAALVAGSVIIVLVQIA